MKISSIKIGAIDPHTQGWDKLEASIYNPCPLVGKTIGAVRHEYDLYIDHIHNSPVAPETRKEAVVDLEIKAGMSISAWGSKTSIRKYARTLIC